MEIAVSVRRSSALGLLFICQCCLSFALLPEEGGPQAPDEVVSKPRAPEYSRRPVSEANFPGAIQRVEELARGLKAKPIMNIFRPPYTDWDTVLMIRCSGPV